MPDLRNKENIEPKTLSSLLDMMIYNNIEGDGNIFPDEDDSKLRRWAQKKKKDLDYAQYVKDAGGMEKVKKMYLDMGYNPEQIRDAPDPSNVIDSILEERPHVMGYYEKFASGKTKDVHPLLRAFGANPDGEFKRSPRQNKSVGRSTRSVTSSGFRSVVPETKFEW